MLKRGAEEELFETMKAPNLLERIISFDDRERTAFVSPLVAMTLESVPRVRTRIFREWNLVAADSSRSLWA